MKITDLTVTLFHWKRPRPRGQRPSAFDGDRQMGLVTVRTDQGVVGHSFLGGPRQGADELVGPLIRLLKPIVVGRNPLDIGAIWADCWKHNRLYNARAICAVDVALWDIAGKVAGLPVHRLLGTTRYSVPAYASSSYIATPAGYAEEAVSFLEQGWTAYKTHPHGVPGEDIAIVTAMRKAVGDRMVLMLDSMWAYDYEGALKVGRAAEELDYRWYEDPLAEDDIYNYVKLKQYLRIPILATEYAPGGLYGMSEWIRQRATDMIRGDVAVKGGITPMVKMCHLAEAFRMKCEIHHGGNSINNLANLHVTMAVPNCDFFEVLLPHRDNKFALLEEIEVDGKGLVHAPEKPGLGAEIDFDLIKKGTIQVLG
ncbi:MAG: mandelate racemase [SAR202 cluster bacterium]|nr:mandelate racemase [SAR202 cluster bacterium]